MNERIALQFDWAVEEMKLKLKESINISPDMLHLSKLGIQ